MSPSEHPLQKKRRVCLQVIATVVALLCLGPIAAANALLTSFNNVTDVGPTSITNLDSNQSFIILGARDGDQVFLAMLHGSGGHGHLATNCSNPPTLASGRRSVTMTVVSEEVFVDPSSLAAGNYTVCFRGSYNDTATDTFVLAPRFMALAVSTVSVGGPVNTDLSGFDCCGNFTAGEYGNCTIHLRDDLGLPTGSLTSSFCNISICPLRDGKGSPITNVTDIVMEQIGVFTFTFVPTGSGCQGTAGVKFSNSPLANRQAYFSVRPSTPASNASTSSCQVLVNGTTLCTITQRDEYENGIRQCTYDSDGGDPVCTEIN